MSRISAHHRKQRLSFRLALFVLSSTALFFLGAFGYNYLYSKKVVLKNVQESASNLTHSLVNRLEVKVQGVEQIPRYLSLRIAQTRPPAQELEDMIKSMLKANPEIFGATVAFEPYAMDPDQHYFAPYLFRDNEGNIAVSELGGEEYHYFHWDWYSIPRHLEIPVWSEPYFDEGGGGILMSTYSIPFYRENQGISQFQGVVTADICLEALVRHFADVQLYDTGYAFLISRNGTFVAHPDPDRVMRQGIFSVAEEMGMPELRIIGRDMIRGARGFAHVTSVHTGQDSLLYYDHVKSTGWSVGVMIPKDEIYSDIVALNHTVVLIGMAGFAILFLVIVAISKSITRPLHSLVSTTREIARGNLDVDLPRVRVNDEVGQLSRSVDQMRLALKEYISDLTETTRAKERIESELKIARNIQMNFLPKKFPPFPNRHEFDIYAMLEPAKEVGGDLYDFFFLDEDHLFFSVGDVSDKGVPAALFMAVTKTLIKGIAEQGLEPSDILARVNNELCQGNDSCMFVTLFCGILDLRTGELKYSSAGHNPPLLLKKGQDPKWLPLPQGMVLGGMEDMVFKTMKTSLAPGDKLLMYTDGVTEAMDSDQKLYSENRLKSEARAMIRDESQDLVKGILNSVHRFARNVPQSDDITLMVLAYKGSSGSAS